ncbi:hypothetical protein ACLF3G_12945 [Falsiroseomonas sp. HC035]|uniref:hypothetical protein n=1 Tax=Falsiroseomonas sp. HC035 TaxID=3390999 RepID=UPI003D315F84
MRTLIHAWPAVAVAMLAALAVLLAARRWAWLGGLVAGAGVLVGWWWVFGSLPASPRQLPERLPLLALALLAWTALGLGWRRAPGTAMAVAGALGAGWWMAGAPRTLSDLIQAAPVLGAVALYALLALRGAGWAPVLAAAALLVGLVLAGLPGPGPLLGAVLLVASLVARFAPAGGLLAGLPVAVALAALASVPVLARGAAVDWAAAAVPLLVISGLRRWGRRGAEGGGAKRR